MRAPLRVEASVGSACSVLGLRQSRAAHGSDGIDAAPIRQRVDSVGSSCSATWAGVYGMESSAFLEGNRDALETAESFLFGRRALSELEAGSPALPLWSPSGAVLHARHMATGPSASAQAASQPCGLLPDAGSGNSGDGATCLGMPGRGASSAAFLIPDIAKVGQLSGPLDGHAVAQETQDQMPLHDHAPILMSTAVVLPWKRRFRFERFWTRLDGFQEAVSSSWSGGDAVPADPLKRLDFTLRRVARDLQRWSMKRVGSIRDQILVANEASKRRWRNHIAVLRNNAAVAFDQAEKEALATSFFVDLLGQPQPREHDMSLDAIGLPEVDLTGLDAHFSEEEIWDVVKAMPSNKSPGPDGLSWEFFRSCWATIKADVVDAVRALFAGRDQCLHQLNSAFVTLLPKREGATYLKDFRPISLVHSFGKLVTKLMALRLAPRMAELVDCNQSAFIRGRCILDNFVLVHQSAALLHRKKVPALLLKLDVARAFDSVSWAFLLSVLRQRGFGPRWISWLVALLRSASTQVLVNGSAGPAFRHGRGLR
ncbi:hypothetical protein ACQ4PT_035885 [Festuca glaucescens]